MSTGIQISFLHVSFLFFPLWQGRGVCTNDDRGHRETKTERGREKERERQGGVVVVATAFSPRLSKHTAYKKMITYTKREKLEKGVSGFGTGAPPVICERVMRGGARRAGWGALPRGKLFMVSCIVKEGRGVKGKCSGCTGGGGGGKSGCYEGRVKGRV